jgi:Co/Zn/Cd efflux system component
MHDSNTDKVKLIDGKNSSTQDGHGHSHANGHSHAKVAEAPKRNPDRKFSDIENMDRYWYSPDLMHDVSQGVLRKLIIVSLVCVTFITVEIIGGVMANS